MSVFGTLRFRIILIVLLAVLPALALILYSGLEQRRLAVLEARQGALQMVHQASMDQMTLVTQTRYLLGLIAERQVIRQGEPEACSASLSEWLPEFTHYHNFAVFDLDGRLRCSAVPYSEPLSSAEQTYFQRVLETHDFAVGGFEIDRLSGKATVNLAYPVRGDQGHINGILIASLDLGWLNRLAAKAELPEGATLTMVGGDHVILARHPDTDRWVGKSAPELADIMAILTEGDGFGEAVGVDGVPKLYAVLPITDAPDSAIIYAGIPSEGVYERVHRELLRNLVLLAGVAVLTLIIALISSHLFVTRKMDGLVEAARQFTKGDLAARAPFSNEKGEIGRLARAFDNMAESLQRREHERVQMEMDLRRSAAQFRTLVEQIPAIAYTAALDEISSTLYVSPKVKDLLGYSPEVFMTDPAIWERLLHPQDHDRVMSELARCHKTKEPLECEYRMIGEDKRDLWFYDKAEVVYDDAGNPSFLQGVMLNVTESKKAAEALRRAHDELEKRVEERTAELEEKNHALSAEIMERQRAEEALQNTLKKLKFFAYSVMHDLKSPAVAIHGLTRMLQKQYGHAMDERSTRCCEQILKASEHVAALVEQINAYLAAKETPLRIETVSVDDMLKTIHDEFSSRLRGREIQWLVPELQLAVSADRIGLLRVFRNFVDNALKYGGDRLTRIGVDYDASDGFHIFSIWDNGVGIRQEEADKIFELFHRNEASRGIEGTGLGLAIVREIVERHGGRIWMETSTKGGTCFRFSVPISSNNRP